jgi:ribose/xylose/arabinose/galactoside ABC-type transport system permease subunit
MDTAMLPFRIAVLCAILNVIFVVWYYRRRQKGIARGLLIFSIPALAIGIYLLIGLAGSLMGTLFLFSGIMNITLLIFRRPIHDHVAKDGR